MKRKRTITVAAVLAIACLLAGCMPGAKAPVPAAAPSVPDGGAVSPQNPEASEACTAYESAVTLTPEALAAQERARRDEIERRYAVYVPFGLTFDREKELFFYEGKTVRYFRDVVNLWNTNGFLYENGVVDLAGQRDGAGELTGLVKATQAAFDARTAELEKRAPALAGVGDETAEAGPQELAG